MRDISAETCRRAHFSVQVEAGCNLTPDYSHSRPADVLISNWALGKMAACDISVTSPLNSNIMSEAGVTAGAAAQATELRKHEANNVKCSELGWLCIPLVVESYGAWGKEAMESFSSLASRLAITSSRPKCMAGSLVRANMRADIALKIISEVLFRFGHVFVCFVCPIIIVIMYYNMGQFPQKCPMFYNIITIKMLCA